MHRYDCIPLPCVRPAVSMTLYTAGCSSAIKPIQATSRSESVHVSLNAAPRCNASYRCSIGPVGVEGRVKVDEVNAIAVQTPENVEVISLSKLSCLQSWDPILIASSLAASTIVRGYRVAKSVRFVCCSKLTAIPILGTGLIYSEDLCPSICDEVTIGARPVITSALKSPHSNSKAYPIALYLSRTSTKIWLPPDRTSIACSCIALVFAGFQSNFAKFARQSRD